MAARVLICATVARHVRQFHLPLIGYLRQRGLEVDVACRLDVDLSPPGVTVHDVPFRRSPWAPSNVSACRMIRALLGTGNYSLINVHTPVAAFWVRLAARGYAGPVIYTAHGLHFHAAMPPHRRALYWLAERLAASSTAALLVMNDEDWLSGLSLGFRPDSSLFRIGGVGVPLSRYAVGDRAAAPGRHGPVVACIGELTPDKQQATLLRAWPGVLRTHPRAVLRIVGDGRLRGRLLRLARRLNIDRSVSFTGWVEDVAGVLAETDLLVHPSRREGLPRVIMEAMAASKPVVASDVRGNRDLVRHGESGLLVPPGDRQALVRGVTRLLADPDLRRRLGRGGRRLVERYSEGRVLAEVWSIYRRFLPGGDGSAQG